ncbi:hypothetical protein TL16_g04281 [Triparma laevis f. inornata]|uniref:Uncharacterized protein n=2 Tax=Triparma laevis TaxID=1534972 RepID=A0A9W7DUQ8_9STRA|nr:hypothetical protein TrLO_g11413 [Triparma laevis f. longispina]GMH65794.1 hypothetical protein TL16_g04281 [Triparma laevis f. inornata]
MSRRTSSASTKQSLTKSQIARAPTVTEQEIQEMWQRARGTFDYPDFKVANHATPKPNTASKGASKGGNNIITANNMKKHVSKSDRIAAQRKEKMRELAKQDALIQQANKDKEEGVVREQVDKENATKQKRYISIPPWEEVEPEEEE